MAFFVVLIGQSNGQGYSLIYDANLNLIKISHDNLNRTLQINTSSEITNYSYDAQYQGTLTNISFGNSSYKYIYDDKLRVIEEKRIIDGIEFNKKYYYDSNDRLVKEILSSGQEIDYYYNQQNKIDKIKNITDQTGYNAFGNPLNRTYFNTVLTSFTYQTDNYRLKQIKTIVDVPGSQARLMQQLNYTYDNVGNIARINDSSNNRSYSMSYDRLDRLTNVSINSYSWIYSFDAIGNILKIIRNNSETTSFKYDGQLAHAPNKVISSPTGIDIYREENYNTSNKTRIVGFFLVNEKNESITDVNWTAEFGDTKSISSLIDFNLSYIGNLMAFIEHNYSQGGNFDLNVTARASASVDLGLYNMIFGTLSNYLSILGKNATVVVTEFSSENNIRELSTNWQWDCNGISSSLPFNMSASEEELLVIIENNYTLQNEYNLTCIVNSTDGRQNSTAILTFDGIAIEDYNSIRIDKDSVLVRFGIKNYFSTLNASWNITADNLLYRSSSPITLEQGQSTSISQQLNFTKGGIKEIKATVYSGDFTDTYTEYYLVKWLTINGFYYTIKNGTTRIMDFIVQNLNDLTTTSRWNTTNPALNYSTNLSSNKSILVFIEENYPEGRKEPTITASNASFVEESIKDIFIIDQIGIISFSTLYDSDVKSVAQAEIINNINPLNLSWRLNKTDAIIASEQNVELNSSGAAIIVVEFNYSASGIYPLTFVINSSSQSDNVTGVAIA